MLTEADHSTTQMAMNHQMRFQGDEKVYAEFYIHPRKNEQKSEKEGRDIYEDVPYVKIMAAGDKDNIVQRPVRDTDKQRFPRQWQAFLNKEEQVQEGTPLAEWAGISRSQVEELKAFGIRTVEALANMPDTANSNFMAIGGLKQKAKAFMEDSKLMAPIERLNKENTDLRAEIDSLKQQMANLQTSPVAHTPLDDVQEEPKPVRRARRKKADATIQDDS